MQISLFMQNRHNFWLRGWILMGVVPKCRESWGATYRSSALWVSTCHRASPARVSLRACMVVVWLLLCGYCCLFCPRARSSIDSTSQNSCSVYSVRFICSHYQCDGFSYIIRRSIWNLNKYIKCIKNIIQYPRVIGSGSVIIPNRWSDGPSFWEWRYHYRHSQYHSVHSH